MSQNAIEVKDVTKIYRLYDRPIDRLKESLSMTHKSLHKDFYAFKRPFLYGGEGRDRGDHRHQWLGKIHDFKDHHRRSDAHHRLGPGGWRDYRLFWSWQPALNMDYTGITKIFI